MTIPIPSGALVIPTTTSPYQSITTQLGSQSVRIDLYTKSLFIPQASPVLPVPFPPLPPIPVTPQYQSLNPVFVDLYLSNVLVVGAVPALNAVPVVRDAYLGFSGDLAVYDTQGEDDVFGVPLRLPPRWLKNWWQLNIGPADAEYAPSDIANSIPGMGTRYLLCYLPA